MKSISRLVPIPDYVVVTTSRGFCWYRAGQVHKIDKKSTLEYLGNEEKVHNYMVNSKMQGISVGDCQPFNPNSKDINIREVI